MRISDWSSDVCSSDLIVSVSLGLPATFLFGGTARADKAARVTLAHGDVVVWVGGDRLRHHGVLPLKDGEHPLLRPQRINFPFLHAGCTSGAVNRRCWESSLAFLGKHRTHPPPT